MEPYLNQRPPPLLTAPSPPGVSLPEKIWDLWQAPRLSECLWPPPLISSPNSDYLLAQCKFILEGPIDTQPRLSLESLQTLCQFRWGFFPSPFPPSSELCSGQLRAMPGSKPHIKSWYQIWITEFLFYGDKFGSNWFTQADC